MEGARGHYGTGRCRGRVHSALSPEELLLRLPDVVPGPEKDMNQEQFVRTVKNVADKIGLLEKLSWGPRNVSPNYGSIVPTPPDGYEQIVLPEVVSVTADLTFYPCIVQA